MTRPNPRISSTPAVPATALLALCLSILLGALQAPLEAQTQDTWTNQKIYDLRRHQQEIPSVAAEHYETAQRYMLKIGRLTEKDDLSKRQQKKLDRAYDKAIQELEATIQEAPDWMEARLALGSVHYKRGALEPARKTYRELLAIEPENERAQAYLGTVEYEIAQREQKRQEQQAATDGGG